MVNTSFIAKNSKGEIIHPKAARMITEYQLMLPIGDKTLGDWIACPLSIFEIGEIRITIVIFEVECENQPFWIRSKLDFGRFHKLLIAERESIDRCIDLGNKGLSLFHFSHSFKR